MELIDSIFYVVILIMSVVVHEVAHGYMAYRLGDNTARMAGRLTLNPLKHLDMFGSIILPLLLIITKAGFVIGWARPVPYNPNNLRNRKSGTFWVAIAGIIANLSIAVIFGLLIRIAPAFGLPPALMSPGGEVSHPFYHIATIIVLLNLVLAVFNLVPIPPLDGSKILFSFLSPRYRFIETFLERWALFILLFFILFLWNFVSPLIFTLFAIITGI
jgi:Zn-dependent protease